MKKKRNAYKHIKKQTTVSGTDNNIFTSVISILHKNKRYKYLVKVSLLTK